MVRSAHVLVYPNIQFSVVLDSGHKASQPLPPLEIGVAGPIVYNNKRHGVAKW